MMLKVNYCRICGQENKGICLDCCFYQDPYIYVEAELFKVIKNV